MKAILFIVLLELFYILFSVSCSKGSSATGNNPSGGNGSSGATTTLDCSTVAKSFSSDVNPIVQSFCNASGCHAAGSTNGPGPLTNYTEVFNARSVIRPAIASGLMPQGSSLTTAQKNSFLCWIDNGAPDN
ncbi:MAG TPA: hypothetical protein VHD35_14700 [Chitinophagaceae bacterium]|nr:hypothetical protein [Chitinophagaceae bacterium]